MAIVGNLQSGYKGKLDGQTYYKGAGGKTVVRKITTPKNPKTLAQRIQRVITKTVGDNYKVMRALADHSFEGRTMGFECANRFRSLNATRIRERAAYLQGQGISLYEYFNFEPIGSTSFAPAAVFISEGSLKQVFPVISGALGKVMASANTYAGVISALGAQRGDQVTFVTVEKSLDGHFSFNYVRVILDPRNSDGAAPLSSEFITNNAINCPNTRNQGNFNTLSFADGGINFKLTDGTVVAVGIIVSRKADNKWLYSTSQLVLSEGNMGNALCSLMEAAESTGVTAIDVESEMYLHNAGEGGVEGTSNEASGGDDTPTLSQNVSINGASQPIGGGSSNLTSLTSFSFNGTFIESMAFKMTKNGGADVQPTTHNSSKATWNIEGAAVNDVYRFYKDNVLMYTITIIAPNPGGSGDSDGDAI